MRVSVLVGSLRKESLSRKFAKALIERAPKSLACAMVEIGELPLYNEDLETAAPEAWTKFRAAIKGSDALLFVTPEYNRSLPGSLKNAIDVGSRPSGKSVWSGLPAAVVSVTPFDLGAFGANHALRQTFVFLNILPMQMPEAYIGKAAERLDEQGNIKDQKTSDLLSKFMNAFDAWVKTNAKKADAHDLGEFMKTRENAAREYVNGKSEALAALLSKNDPATFFSPNGDVVNGAGAIAARYAKDAELFRDGGTTKLEVLHAWSSGDLAFWTGYQHAEAKLGDHDEKIPMTLRITEVFRLEDGELKLVHRHADSGKPDKKS